MISTIPSSISPLSYARIYSDARGESHFETVIVEQSLVKAAPPAPAFLVSAERPCSGYLLYSFEPGWGSDLHPAPKRQFTVLLSGTLEVSTSDGEVRTFSPGDLGLLEDITGKGHRTRNAGKGVARLLVLPVSG